MNRHSAALLFILLAMIACNFPTAQGGGPMAASPNAATLSVTNPPQVAVEEPANGSQAVLKDAVTVRVHATDSIGITRIELHEAGRLVVTQPVPDPNPDVTALLVYRPTSVGKVILEVVAYRQSTPSSPVTLTLEVVGSRGQLANAGSPEPTRSAAGAVCMARVAVNGLSLRAGPSVNYRFLAALKVGEELAVIGRNAEGTWYQIRRVSPGADAVATGWVSAPYTTTEGDCDRAPVVTPGP